jgi:hypothetical protein
VSAEREDVRAALDRAVALAGGEVLRQPRRLRALLTDLVGRSATDHRNEIDAMVTAAEERARNPSAAPAALRRRHVDGQLADWALATLQRHDPEPDDGEATSGAGRRRPGRRAAIALSAIGVALVASVVLWIVLPSDPVPVPGPDPTPTRPDATTTTERGTTSSPEAMSFRVEFDRAGEGAFRVSRTWIIGDGRVAGAVALTPTATGPAQHRELVPAEAFVDPVFTPAPDNRRGDVAVYNLSPSGDDISLTFEADLVVDEPDEATVRSWVEAWQVRVSDLRPLDDTPAANATITPLD